jgi:uncharacterized membrane-anchored protein YhcB (DUF1043 family)
LNNAVVTIIIVIIIAVCIGILANSNYEEVTTIRDQRNLQLSLQDCKRLFDVGEERTECFEKSFDVFGTEQQKQQWYSGYFNP